VASRVLQTAQRAGASEADVMASRGTDFEVKVADGAVVTLTQAVAKGLGLRVFVDGRLGFCTTSDFRKDSLEHAAKRAVAMAKEAAADPHNGLAEAKPGLLRAGDHPELDLYDPRIPALSTEEKISWAHRMEEEARDTDPRVTRFRDSGVASGETTTVLVTSEGAARTRRSTGVTAWCNPLATADGELQTEVWYDAQTHLEDLEPIESIGRTAAHRAARMLGARPLPTRNVPVIFEPQIAIELLGGVLSGIDGDLVYKKASFLADRLDEPIAAPTVTLVDDPHLRRGPASTPFDGEGLATGRKLLVDAGTLTTFLYDTYTARKAAKRCTANARRAWSSLPGIGPFNFYVEAGEDDPEEILSSARRALIITRGLGQGLNVVSGEYSRGANGLWVENGEVVHPVQEVTIAGDYVTLLRSIDRVGSDLRMRGSAGAPTVRVASMTVSGR
jgi:PmbA protein